MTSAQELFEGDRPVSAERVAEFVIAQARRMPSHVLRNFSAALAAGRPLPEVGGAVLLGLERDAPTEVPQSWPANREARERLGSELLVNTFRGGVVVADSPAHPDAHPDKIAELQAAAAKAEAEIPAAEEQLRAREHRARVAARREAQGQTEPVATAGDALRSYVVGTLSFSVEVALVALAFYANSAEQGWPGAVRSLLFGVMTVGALVGLFAFVLPTDRLSQPPRWLQVWAAVLVVFAALAIAGERLASSVDVELVAELLHVLSAVQAIAVFVTVLVASAFTALTLRTGRSRETRYRRETAVRDELEEAVAEARGRVETLRAVARRPVELRAEIYQKQYRAEVEGCRSMTEYLRFRDHNLNAAILTARAYFSLPSYLREYVLEEMAGLLETTPDHVR